jgi:hypothetical protein
MAAMRSKKIIVETPAQRKRKGLYSLLSQIPVEKIYEIGLRGPVVRRVAWLFMLMIIYIWNTHQANKMMYRLKKTKEQIEDLRVDYTTIKYEYMFKSKQSEVAKSMEPLMIKESSVPPKKIKIEAE